MWQKISITVCAVLFAVLCAVPAVFADDIPESSSTGSVPTISDDAGQLGNDVTGNLSDGVDNVKDDLLKVHGSWESMQNDFPLFIKEALTFVPENYWFAFSLSILLGFILALYRRMA